MILFFLILIREVLNKQLTQETLKARRAYGRLAGIHKRFSVTREILWSH